MPDNQPSKQNTRNKKIGKKVQTGKGKRQKGSNEKVVVVEEDNEGEHEPLVFQQPRARN